MRFFLGKAFSEKQRKVKTSKKDDERMKEHT